VYIFGGRTKMSCKVNVDHSWVPVFMSLGTLKVPLILISVLLLLGVVVATLLQISMDFGY
jgi:hypothetical protein